MANAQIPPELKLKAGIYEVGFDQEGNINYLVRKTKKEAKKPAMPGFFNLQVKKDSTILYV